MSTISEVKGSNDWRLSMKLVNKLVFVKWFPEAGRESLHLIKLLYLDDDGQTIELKSWKPPAKSYCVYKKVVPNERYLIRGWRPLVETESDYSTSNNMAYKWYVEDQMNGHPEPRKYLNCFTNLNKIIALVRQKKPVNILGIFLEYYKGPTKGRRIQGYFVKLEDEAGAEFLVLIWHFTCVEKPTKFALFNCQRGDVMLINDARASFPPRIKPQLFTVTSLFPPVVNSMCVDQRRVNDLKRRYRTANGSS